MTVRELKKRLAKYPDYMDVVIAERVTEFAYGSIDSVKKKKINYSEEPGGKSLAKDDVVVLSEEY
jgi:hypothetical protein